MDRPKLTKEEIDIGSRIKKVRLRNGMTQAEFGAIIGKSPSTIYAYERNLIIPPFKVLCQISYMFNIDINSLTGYGIIEFPEGKLTIEEAYERVLKELGVNNE